MSCPWRDAPDELLAHAAEHMRSDDPRDNRMAFVSIDNAVHLALKIFIGLPRRVTGIKRPKRNDIESAARSFENLLEMFENLAGHKFPDIPLEKIEWYHDLRNGMYHCGSVAHVGRKYVREYYDIAQSLTQCLFGDRRPEENISRQPTSPRSNVSDPEHVDLKELIQRYKSTEHEYLAMARAMGARSKTLLEAVDYLYIEDYIDISQREAIQRMRRVLFEKMNRSDDQVYRIA